MRLSTLAVLASPTLALAVPNYLKLANSPSEIAAQAISAAKTGVGGAAHETKTQWDQIKDAVEGFGDEGLKVANVEMHGIEYLSLTHPAFPQHRLRVVSPNICDPDVNQLSGYLDISETRHLFFWFQESRRNATQDPLVLWLNGGPGCSSVTGLLFELGGCAIADKGENITYNEHSWNTVANILYLDQPIGVGFSYSDEGEVNNSPAAAEDVYAFLTLFISKFRTYAEQPFHIAGESYAGTYIPNIASVIYNNNLALDLAPVPDIPKLNFQSVLIGNGLSEAGVQFESVHDWACNSTYGPFIDDPYGAECTSLQTKGARCKSFVRTCQKTNSRFTCVPAALTCWTSLSALQDLGLNMYDVRRKCNKDADKDGPLCYKEMGWMETYLNKPEIKKELGAPEGVTYQSCNMQINQNFLLQGDGMHDAASLLLPLIASDIRVLLYAGEADMMVNTIGVSRVLDQLASSSSYAAEYNRAEKKDFYDVKGEVVGSTKKVGKGAGNLAFTSFKNAGHMVPHDDPVAALTMFSRWLDNKPLAK
ncbi:hypothetical protein IAR55_007117 [Kwoniella newhampshirensis]|uniref:Carboxypeptidase n=1 Tax=Kwoniella newhampshirensis TaxID=1651941 RepID=A0AAW0YTA5_9TREE